MKKQLHKWTRKAHRYLGLFIGLQFLAWTIGGLYFSWIDLDIIHGSDRLNPPTQLDPQLSILSPSPIIEKLLQTQSELVKLELVTATPNKAYYLVSIRHKDDENTTQTNHLIDAITGEYTTAITKDLAVEMAQYRFKLNAAVTAVRYIEKVDNSHHEYRELPLPVYAVEFDDTRRTTFYIAPELAKLVSIRNGQWRIFDFFWMLHTMDYEGRDNFNNYLLRTFSILGLLTILSGFALFALSSPIFRAKTK